MSPLQLCGHKLCERFQSVGGASGSFAVDLVYEATKAIRRLQNRSDAAQIPIIAMTANAFAEDVQASLDAGMNGHLSKPIVMDEVIKTIARNLDR